MEFVVVCPPDDGRFFYKMGDQIDIQDIAKLQVKTIELNGEIVGALHELAKSQTDSKKRIYTIELFVNFLVNIVTYAVVLLAFSLVSYLFFKEIWVKLQRDYQLAILPVLLYLLVDFAKAYMQNMRQNKTSADNHDIV